MNRFHGVGARAASRYWLSRALALAVLIGGTMLGPAANASVDPNALPPSFREVSCGGGQVVRLYTPPTGFDPLTATDEQLEANALPPRPANADDLAVWERFIAMPNDTSTSCPVSTGRQHGPNRPRAGSTTAPTNTAAPTNTLTPSVAAASGVDSLNWAGNVAINQSYTDAFGAWKVVAASSSPAKFYSSTWVGVGGGNSTRQPLIQAGTESDSDTTPYLWWELYPQNSEQRIGAVNRSDSIYVHAHLVYNNDWVVAEDLTSGLGKGKTYGLSTTSIWPSNQAEWIFERPTVGGYLTQLAEAPPTFTGATAYGTGYSGTELENLPHNYYWMYDCVSNTLLAYPTGIGSGGGFGFRWLNPGSRC